MASHRILEAMCQKIVQQVDRTNSMIDLILASARMEHIDTKEFKQLSMHTCVQEAVESYPLLTSERKKLHISIEQDFSFIGSQALMIFALSNMIKNSLYAMKAAEKGEIHIRVARSDHQGILSVTDTASGIPKAIINRIFDTYYSTKQSAGAGVGLAFCLRVIKAFGGNISCDSVQGEYTTFTVTLPMASVPQSAPDEPKRLNTI